MEILRDDRLLEEQRLFDDRYHINSDYQSRGSSYDDSEVSDTESNSGKEQRDFNSGDSQSKCGSNNSKFTTSDFYSDGKSQVSLPSIPTKIVTLVIPDNASDYSNKKNIFACNQADVKPIGKYVNTDNKLSSKLVGSKRLYLKTFQKINMSAP